MTSKFFIRLWWDQIKLHQAQIGNQNFDLPSWAELAQTLNADPDLKDDNQDSLLILDCEASDNPNQKLPLRSKLSHTQGENIWSG